MSADVRPDAFDSDDVSLDPSSNFQFGYGVRIGLLSESIVVPRRLVHLDRARSADDQHRRQRLGRRRCQREHHRHQQHGRDDASVAHRGEQEPDRVFGIAAGVGQDRYDQAATLTGTVNAVRRVGDASRWRRSNRWRRTNFFGDLSINLPLFKIVGEVGDVPGGIGRDVQLVRRRTRRPLAGLRIGRPSPEPVRSPGAP